MMRLPALAIHVDRECHITCSSELPRAVSRVLIVTPPLVHDQDRRTPAGSRIIEGEQTFQRESARLILDFAFLDCTVCDA